MAQTPAHIKHAHGPDQRISAYRSELVEVQNLYLDRRYKQCIGLCEELQRAEIHPVHRVFLWFYYATSYESIGLIAHDYSNNKLRFLDLAKEGFNRALRSLSLPYVATETGLDEQPEHSPLSSLFATPSMQYASLRMQDMSPNKAVMGAMAQSTSAYSIYSIQSVISEPYTLVDVYKCPSSDIHDPVTPRAQRGVETPEFDCLTVQPTPATHKSRLSQSLSLEHQLAEELVPSPLFSRISKKAQITVSDGTITARPLPPLPFKHQASFEMNGSRIVQIPTMRKTAVQTLISRYEGSLPSMSSPVGSPSSTPIHRNIDAFTPSPLTPRFKAIRDAFTPNPSNGHLEAYLSSPDMTRYNAYLADLRTQLRNHIAYLDREINRVHRAQDERTAAKALCKTRFASFWSLEHTACTSKWRPRGAQASETTTTHSSSLGDEAALPARAGEDRIEQLRREGWVVRKEKFGFKGSEFYDDLSRRVESELAAAARRKREYMIALG